MMWNMIELLVKASCFMYWCIVFTCKAITESVWTLCICFGAEAGPAARPSRKTEGETKFSAGVKEKPLLSQTHVPQERLDTLSLQRATTESFDKSAPSDLTANQNCRKTKMVCCGTDGMLYLFLISYLFLICYLWRKNYPRNKSS